MSRFEFIFMVTLICLIAHDLYENQAKVMRPDAGRGIKWLAATLAVGIDVGLALGVAWVITRLQWVSP